MMPSQLILSGVLWLSALFALEAYAEEATCCALPVTPAKSASFEMIHYAKDAELESKKSKTKLVLNDGVVSGWNQDGSLTWQVHIPSEVKGASVVLHYKTSASKEGGVDCYIGERKYDFEVFPTVGKKGLIEASIGVVDLPPGDYAIKLMAKKINHMSVEYMKLTTNPPRDPFAGVMELFVKKDTWAETMVAMFAKRQTPEVQADLALFNGQIDAPLAQKDGQALWQYFAKETDWFLQDNKENKGFFTYKGFDSRGDFDSYFNADRTTEFEQALIHTVCTELGEKGRPFEDRLEVLVHAHTPIQDTAWLQLYTDACWQRRLQRVAPLLAQTSQLIYATHQNMGSSYLKTEYQGCPDGSALRAIDLRPLKKGNPLNDTLLLDAHNGILRDPELSCDGKRLLFAWRKTNKTEWAYMRMGPLKDNYKIYEMDLATKTVRQLTDDDTYGADFEPCYMPNGDIMFSSSRIVQDITCGFGDGSNMFLMNKDGKYARRIGFDQTQTGFPHMLDDGRVIYTRRDYNDRGQSYGHGLFVMNPDGTKQMEYYGNNSFYPTTFQHTRQIPGTGKTMAVAGGYHSSQGGKLVKLDPRNGNQYEQGLVYQDEDATRFEGQRGENYLKWGPLSSYPYPFDEESFLISYNPIGSFLANKEGQWDHQADTIMRYNLYYMTWDGRRELLAADPVLSSMQGIPVMPREEPLHRASVVDYTKDTGTCYIQNVYFGPSAEGIQAGSVKKLRVVKMIFKYAAIGAGGMNAPGKVGPGGPYGGYGWHSTMPVGVGSASFDAKAVLGEVDVYADGSAMFEVPARTPFYFQLIDEHGQAIQTMRSWATLMPNESFSCVGCHENKRTTPLSPKRTIAMTKGVQKIRPTYDISGKPFSYAKMVQPILNQHCVSCHSAGKKAAKYDLSDTLVIDSLKEKALQSTRHKFYQSYLTLLEVGRRRDGTLDCGVPNDNVNYFTRLATVELTPPYYAGSTQSGLMKKLLAGHGKTQLSPAEIETIATWIDLNVPFIGEYDELNTWDEKANTYWDARVKMRNDMDNIDTANVNEFIKAGQP